MSAVQLRWPEVAKARESDLCPHIVPLPKRLWPIRQHIIDWLVHPDHGCSGMFYFETEEMTQWDWSIRFSDLTTAVAMKVRWI